MRQLNRAFRREDKIRILTRLACEVAWSRLNAGSQTQAGDLERRAVDKLRRFVKRNVDESNPEGLTRADVGLFEVADLEVDRGTQTFTVTVNDKTVAGDFEIILVDGSDPHPECVNLIGYEDALMIEAVTKELEDHVAYHGDFYIEQAKDW